MTCWVAHVKAESDVDLGVYLDDRTIWATGPQATFKVAQARSKSMLVNVRSLETDTRAESECET